MSRTDKDRPYWVRCNDNLEQTRVWFDGFEHVTVLENFHWSPVPRWFVRSRYHAPLRREARDVLRMAARDHNSNGWTELEPEPRQGRNSAAWAWW